MKQNKNDIVRNGGVIFIANLPKLKSDYMGIVTWIVKKFLKMEEFNVIGKSILHWLFLILY